MLNLRRMALDLNLVFRKLAYFFGMLSLRSEKWYNDLTEEKRS